MSWAEVAATSDGRPRLIPTFEICSGTGRVKSGGGSGEHSRLNGRLAYTMLRKVPKRRQEAGPQESDALKMEVDSN